MEHVAVEGALRRGRRPRAEAALIIEVVVTHDIEPTTRKRYRASGLPVLRGRALAVRRSPDLAMLRSARPLPSVVGAHGRIMPARRAGARPLAAAGLCCHSRPRSPHRTVIGRPRCFQRRSGFSQL